MKAIITFKDKTKLKLNKLTEVHYCYPSQMGLRVARVAFESDIKQTGRTMAIEDIKEIEIFNK